MCKDFTPVLAPMDSAPGEKWNYTGYKAALVATLDGLVEYIGEDVVTANDSHAIALLEWLHNYVQDDM